MIVSWHFSEVEQPKLWLCHDNFHLPFSWEARIVEKHNHPKEQVAEDWVEASHEVQLNLFALKLLSISYSLKIYSSMVIDMIDWLTCRSDSWTSWTFTWTNGYSTQQDRIFLEDSQRRNIPGETMFQDMYAKVCFCNIPKNQPPSRAL